MLRSDRSFSFTKRCASTGVFDKVKEYFGVVTGRGLIVGNAQSLYFNAKSRAENQNWHTQGLLGSDFRTTQTLLVIHVWMLHKRLLEEGSKDGLLIQECMFDELWEDTSNRIRSHNINELSINKYLKGVQGYSFRTCLELDEAMTKIPDEEEVVEEIGGVLWRMAYLRRDDIQPEHVMKFAHYIRDEQHSLSQIPKEAIYEGRFKWGPLPQWEGARTSYSKSSAPVVETLTDDSSVPEKGVWKEATAQDGKTYYWNTLTRESSWDMPPTESVV